MPTHTNEICRECPIAYNALNGRYCKRIGKYVEYATEPECVNR